MLVMDSDVEGSGREEYLVVVGCYVQEGRETHVREFGGNAVGEGRSRW
jgi:hypothetical protein